MSSSPSPSVRTSRVIRHPGGLLPAAPLVTPRAGFSTPGGEQVTTLEALLDGARRAGVEEGRLAGLAEAVEGIDASRAAAVAAVAAEISRTAAGLSALRAEVVDEVVDDAVGLAFELVDVLLGRALASSDTPGRDAVARALALVPHGQDLVVKVHPDCGLDDEDIAGLAGDRGVHVVRDAAVDRYGCVLTVGACHVDAQLPAALERVRRCLEGVRPTAAREVAS
ncbi:MAG: FliH/SctL family protein [Acidimicrobiales bacterium]